MASRSETEAAIYQHHAPRSRNGKPHSGPVVKEDLTTAAYDSFLAEIEGLVGQMNALHLQAVREYGPEVERLIRSGSQDRQQIERALDRLLDHVCVPEGLRIFRALCRYSFRINPAATARYVQAYRELWEGGGDTEMEN